MIGTDTIMLGQQMDLEVTAYDIFNLSVSAPVMVSLACNKDNNLVLPGSRCQYSLGGTRLVQVNKQSDEENTLNRTAFYIKGPQQQSLSARSVVLTWETLENAPVSLAHLDVQVRSQCKYGYVYDAHEQKCTCSSSNHVHCNETTYTACVEEGYWFGEVDNDGTYEAIPCPFGNCNYTIGSCPTGPCPGKNAFCNLRDEDRNALCYGNRANILCSQCKPNSSFTFDAIKCTDQCSGWSIVWVIGLILVFWAFLIAALLVITGLDFHIGSGRLYCFLFFFSVLQYFVGGTFPSPVLYVIEVVITGFIQLNPKFWGFIPVCLYEGLHSMWYMVLSYIHPLFLGCVILVLVCCSRKHRLPCFHERRGINAICILLYLSFFSLTQTSLSFLAPVTFTTQNNSLTTRVSIDADLGYWSTTHAVFVPVAILVQLCLVIPFLLLLIFSPCLNRFPVFGQAMHRLKPIIDEFQGCYKDSYRSFAGFYLAWRQIIFLLDLVSTSQFVTIYLLQISSIIMLLIHAVFQPYKDQWLNALDAVFIADLQLLSILHGSTANVVFESPVLLVIKKVIIVILVLLPLMYFAVLCLYPIGKRIFVHLPCRRKLRQLHTVVEHTEWEREPLIFEQSNCSINQLSINDHSKSRNRVPTTSVVGLSASDSFSANYHDM